MLAALYNKLYLTEYICKCYFTVKLKLQYHYLVRTIPHIAFISLNPVG